MPETPPPPTPEPQPSSRLWLPVLEDFLQTAPYTMEVERGFAEATHLLFGFVKRGIAADLGEIQAHLHETESPFQLTAMPRIAAVKFMFPGLGDKLVITDPVANEPKTHGLALSFDASTTPLASYLAMRRRNHTRNIRELREDTGRFDLPDSM